MRKYLFLLLGFLLFSCGTSKKMMYHDNPVIAHRGAWKAKDLPQNSLAALQEAIDLQSHGSEFDIHITKDDSLVVNHNPDYFGMPIAETTFSDLRKQQLPNNEKIPTLKEYLQEGMKQTGTKLILEIKKSPTQERTLELTKKAVAQVHDINAQKWIEYITFDYAAGKLIARLDPEAEVAYLTGDVPPAKANADGYTGLDYHFSVYKKNPDWIKQAQQLGMTINAWTVNTEEEMKRLLAQDVNYITTDEPELLFKVIAEMQK